MLYLMCLNWGKSGLTALNYKGWDVNRIVSEINRFPPPFLVEGDHFSVMWFSVEPYNNVLFTSRTLKEPFFV